MTDRHALTAALDRIRGALGRVDIVVTNAGGTGGVDTGQDPDAATATWHDVLDRNLTGTFYTVLALARHLPRPGGRVITLSSIASATGGSPGALAYAAAKAGTDGFTRALAGELGPQGIAVNAVAPGYVAGTRFFGEGDQTERRERFARLIPSGRVGDAAGHRGRRLVPVPTRGRSHPRPGPARQRRAAPRGLSTVTGRA